MRGIMRSFPSTRLRMPTAWSWAVSNGRSSLDENLGLRHIGEDLLREHTANPHKSSNPCEEYRVHFTQGRGVMIDALELLKRYNEPTPRYTSYPPAPHWQEAHGGLLISALRRSVAPLSIYVHIPFC